MLEGEVSSRKGADIVAIVGIKFITQAVSRSACDRFGFVQKMLEWDRGCHECHVRCCDLYLGFSCADRADASLRGPNSTCPSLAMVPRHEPRDQREARQDWYLPGNNATRGSLRCIDRDPEPVSHSHQLGK